MKVLKLIAISFFICLFSCSSLKNDSPKTTANEPTINWLSMEELQKKMKHEPKKVFIDVYATWCGPCKMMKKKTFSDGEVIKYVNENYYAVQFDAESDSSIIFKGKEFNNPHPSEKHSIHELASEIAIFEGSLRFPTIVYFDEELNKITPRIGYRNANDFLLDLKFFGDDIYKEKTFDQYRSSLFLD